MKRNFYFLLLITLLVLISEVSNSTLSKADLFGKGAFTLKNVRITGIKATRSAYLVSFNYAQVGKKIGVATVDVNEPLYDFFSNAFAFQSPVDLSIRNGEVWSVESTRIPKKTKLLSGIKLSNIYIAGVKISARTQPIFWLNDSTGKPLGKIQLDLGKHRMRWSWTRILLTAYFTQTPLNLHTYSNILGLEHATYIEFHRN